MKFFLLTIQLLVMSHNVLLAQTQIKKSNYIYIFDCTKSMINFGILDKTLTFLYDDIGERIPGNEITIVLFQEKPLETEHFLREEFDQKWPDIEKKIRDHAQHVTNTNICNAWEKGLDFIDEGKYNYIYLMTDGVDNAHGKEGTEMMCRLIRDWCNQFRDSRAHYVELYEGALNEQIMDAIKESCNFIAIPADVHEHFMSFDSQKIIVNTRELDKTVRLHSDRSRETPMEVTCNDPYFNVVIEGGKLRDGGIADFRVNMRVSQQQFNEAIDHAPEYHFNCTITTPESDLRIENATLEVVVINKPERVLDAGFTGGAHLGCSNYYPSFLFCSASGPDTLSVDLKTQFNEDALAAGAFLRMKVKSDIENDQFTLLYNGQEQDDKTFVIAKNEGQSLLQIVFDPEAEDGDRNFLVTPLETNELDRVNQSSPEEYVLTLEAEYDIDWNPLAFILFWLAIILVGLTVLWLLCLKPITRPNFRGIRSLTLEDSKNNFYKPIPVKNYHMIVFCKERKKQNSWAALFLGKTYYWIDSRWSSPIIMTPGSGGKIRVQAGSDYNLSARVWKAGTKQTILGVNNKDLNMTATIN